MLRTLTIEDLASVLSVHPRTIYGAAVGSEATIADLVQFGVLAPAGVVTHRLCDRCDRQHLAEIESSPDGQGWYCPADGFVVAEAADIAAYKVRVDAFVFLLARCVDRPRRWAKPRAAPIVWSIGSFAYANLQVAIYFAVNISTLDVLNDLMPFLDGDPRTDGFVVLTSDNADLSRLILPRTGRIVSMLDCLSITTTGQLEMRREWLARHVLPEHLLRRSKAGRRNTAEKLAAELIVELDQDGQLRALSGSERHRVLQAASQRKHGPLTTLSKTPCNKAWAAYIAATGSARRTS